MKCDGEEKKQRKEKEERKMVIERERERARVSVSLLCGGVYERNNTRRGVSVEAEMESESVCSIWTVGTLLGPSFISPHGPKDLRIARLEATPLTFA